jgi:hypothetical protein
MRRGIDKKDKTMPAPPVYQVEFIPLERRLDDRRVAPRDAALPADITADRRMATTRRTEDHKPATPATPATLKVV